MKIYIYISSLNGGGAERVVVNLTNALASMGIRTTLLVGTNNGDYWSYVNSDVHLIKLGARRALFSIFSLIRIVRREKPDIVLATLRGPNTVLATLKPFLLKDVKIAIREASIYRAPRTLTEKIYDIFQRLFYNNADLFIANSKDTLTSFLASPIRLPSKTVILHNPIYDPSIKVASDAELHHPWLNQNSDKVIVAAGRLVPEKGFDVLLEAIALLRRRAPGVRCIILGEGRERKNLKEKARSLLIEDCVDFPGFQQNPYPFIARADVFILPSRWEGFGNVLVEALALNTPIVATRCPGGPAEILENGKWGQMVPAEDPFALAEAMAFILENPPTENLAARAKDFEIRHIAGKYLAALRDLLR